MINDQKYSSNIINQTGKNRLLLQKIKSAHIALIANREKELQSIFRDQLSDAATALESNHQTLLDREQSENLGAEMWPSVRQMYFNPPIQLNSQIVDYIAFVRTISSNTNQDLNAHSTLSASFIKDTSNLLDLMDMVVQAEVTYAENALERIKLIESVLWLLTLIVLGLEGLFIFRPMMNTITDQLEQLKQLKQQKLNLEENLHTLKTTQKELVKTQNITSLGRMVSGFSHELSTPIGIAVSAVSQIEDAANRINYELGTKHSSTDMIKKHSAILHETALLASKNLSRAGRLMENFKQSSIDRHSERSRDFDLKKLTEDTIYNLSHQLKKSQLVLK